MTADEKNVKNEAIENEEIKKLKDDELKKTSGGVLFDLLKPQTKGMFAYDNPIENTGNGTIFGGDGN